MKLTLVCPKSFLIADAPAGDEPAAAGPAAARAPGRGPVGVRDARQHPQRVEARLGHRDVGHTQRVGRPELQAEVRGADWGREAEGDAGQVALPQAPGLPRRTDGESHYYP